VLDTALDVVDETIELGIEKFMFMYETKDQLLLRTHHCTCAAIQKGPPGSTTPSISPAHFVSQR
jgi:hypothetical protein